MTTLKGERTTTTNIRGSRRGRSDEIKWKPIVPTTASTVLYHLQDTNNSIPRWVRSVKDHHYLVVVDVGCNNQPVARKEEVDNNMSRCYNSGLHRWYARVNYDESTAFYIILPLITAKDTIRGDLK